MAKKPYKNHIQYTTKNRSTISHWRKARGATNEEYVQEYSRKCNKKMIFQEDEKTKEATTQEHEADDF